MGLTPVTLVAGGTAGGREAMIAGALLPGAPGAAILEGLADGGSTLAALAVGDLPGAPGVSPPLLFRIAPGCLCCTGNLVLRVTLNRLLRHPPAQLFISLADASHMGQLRGWLAAAPYDQLLCLTPDLLVRN